MSWLKPSEKVCKHIEALYSFSIKLEFRALFIFVFIADSSLALYIQVRLINIAFNQEIEPPFHC